MSVVEDRLGAMGIDLPEAPQPLGNFVPFLVDGGDLFISGQISIGVDGNVVCGKLGHDLDVQAGVEAARCCGIGILARARAAIGDLDQIAQVINLGAFVNAVPAFSGHPRVVNGASDLLVAAFGPEVGRHVRFAVGSSSLPAGAAIEIEAVFRLKEGRWPRG